MSKYFDYSVENLVSVKCFQNVFLLWNWDNIRRIHKLSNSSWGLSSDHNRVEYHLIFGAVTRIVRRPRVAKCLHNEEEVRKEPTPTPLLEGTQRTESSSYSSCASNTHRRASRSAWMIPGLVSRTTTAKPPTTKPRPWNASDVPNGAPASGTQGPNYKRTNRIHINSC